jgi:phosphoribosylanthranilate isomerase
VEQHRRRVKICGITQPQQGRAIAELGATALGLICARISPRYVTPQQIQEIVEALPPAMPDRIGVFVNAPLEEIASIVAETGLTGVQLHGDETPEFCRQLRQHLPGIELIKAFRVKDSTVLDRLETYTDAVDTFLLDAYHPDRLGGTGRTIAIAEIERFRPSRPWLLAGGLNPDNIGEVLSQVQPDGIDLSSGVERSPGDKDLNLVARLFAQLQVISGKQ